MKKPKHQTLLQKALAAEGARPRWRSRPSDEEVELACAWLHGRVSDIQAAKAMGRAWQKPGAARNATDTLWRILRRAVKLDMVTFTIKAGH